MKITLIAFVIVNITTLVTAGDKDVAFKFTISKRTYFGSAEIGGGYDMNLWKDPVQAKLDLLLKHNNKKLSVSNYQNVYLATIPDVEEINIVDIKTLNWVQIEITNIIGNDSFKHLAFTFKKNLQALCPFQIRLSNLKYAGSAELVTDLGLVPFVVVREFQEGPDSDFLKFANNLSNAKLKDIEVEIHAPGTLSYKKVAVTSIFDGPPIQIHFSDIPIIEETNFWAVMGNNVVSRVEFFGSVIVERTDSPKGVHYSAPVGWTGILSLHNFTTNGEGTDIFEIIKKYPAVKILIRVENLWWQLQHQAEDVRGDLKTAFLARIVAQHTEKWVLKLTSNGEDFCGYAMKGDETNPTISCLRVDMYITDQQIPYLNLQQTMTEKVALYRYFSFLYSEDQVKEIQHAFLALQTTQDPTFVNRDLDWYPIRISFMEQIARLTMRLDYLVPKEVEADVLVTETLNPLDKESSNILSAKLYYFTDKDLMIEYKYTSESGSGRLESAEILLKLTDKPTFDYKDVFLNDAKTKLLVRRKHDLEWLRFYVLDKYCGNENFFFWRIGSN